MPQVDAERKTQNSLYEQACEEFGAALDRLVRAYEADADKRRDLYQEIHMAVWRSFEKFEARCSLPTWVYRIAHNVASDHIVRQRRSRLASLISIEELDGIAAPSHESDANDRLALERLLQLIHRLRPPDRQLMLLYLKDMDATAIGEITGLSPANVRTKVRRIKEFLSHRMHRRPV
jgi:RNA polymerase sigma-70 factor (ECF subfamily)